MINVLSKNKNMKELISNKLSFNNIFVLCSCVLFLAFAVGLLNNPFGSAQRNIFFAYFDDFFADFFNVLRYIADRDPYFNPINGETPYFPLSYLILYPFSQLDNFNSMSLHETWNSKIGLMSVFFFTIFFFFFLFFSLNQLKKKYDVPPPPPAVFTGLVLSYTFFITIERGNTIMLAAAFVVFFICYYDSECKNERVLAIISLALAVTLKVFPVIFGFLYFEKKQYREIFQSAIVTLLLVFIPFLFFKRGFANIPQLVNNVLLNSENYNFTRDFPRFSLAHLVFYGSGKLKFSLEIIFTLSKLAQIISLLASGVSIIFACLIKNKWLKISLLTMAVLFLPTNSGWYCGLYMFPMIVLFFSTTQERTKLFNIFILVVFIMFLNPFQIIIKNNHLNYYIGNIVLLSLWLVLLIISGKQIVMKYIKRRQV
jgi:hypothetical protein